MRDLRVFVIDLVVVPFLVGVLPSSINKRINNFAHFILPTVIMWACKLESFAKVYVILTILLGLNHRVKIFHSFGDTVYCTEYIESKQIFSRSRTRESL